MMIKKCLRSWEQNKRPSFIYLQLEPQVWSWYLWSSSSKPIECSGFFDSSRQKPLQASVEVAFRMHRLMDVAITAKLIQGSWWKIVLLGGLLTTESLHELRRFTLILIEND